MARIPKGLLATGAFEVTLDHHGRELLDGGLGLPAELLHGLGGVTQQEVNFRGAEITRVKLDEVLEVESGVLEGQLRELADTDGAADRKSVV